MTFDIPVRNKEGAITATMTCTDEQMKIILEFGLNFLVATGLASAYGLKQEESTQMPLQFND